MQVDTWCPLLPRPQLRAPGGDTQPAPGSVRPTSITGLGHCCQEVWKRSDSRAPVIF